MPLNGGPLGTTTETIWVCSKTGCKARPVKSPIRPKPHGAHPTYQMIPQQSTAQPRRAKPHKKRGLFRRG